MRRLRVLFVAALLTVLAACGSDGRAPFPDVTITSVNPAELAPGAELIITGSNYYAVSGVAGTRVEVCGVTFSGTLIEPLTRSILLPPGGTITAEVGNMLTGALPTEGFTPGLSDVRLTRPDGSSAVLVNGVTWVDPGKEPEPTPVTAVITASNATGIAPVTISFDATGSTGIAPLTYGWSFGDDTEGSNDAETEHEFATAGIYTVTLTVTDANGETDTVDVEFLIAAPTPVNAVITTDTVSGTAPFTLEFSALHSAGEGDLAFAWHFGVDGATASRAEVSYEYQQVGTYTVTLTVTDETGAESVATEQITVNPVLQAVIQHGESTSYAPVALVFDATDSTGIAPLTYTWDFGSETPAMHDAETVHEFTAGGNYTVALTVTDVNGETDTAQVELFIRTPEPVNAVITTDTVAGTAPLTVNFSALDSTGEGELHFTWDFDGATNEHAETPFTFLVGGAYTVTLTVIDETGAAHSTSQVIDVELAPATLSFVNEPAGLNPDGAVSVTGVEFSETVNLPDGTLNLPPGEYTVTPTPFELIEMVAGQQVISMWTVPPQTITLGEGEVLPLALGFEPTAGQLEVALNDLPAGNHLAAVAVTPLHTPLGLTADTSDVSQLLPGIYEVSFSTIRSQNDGWVAEYEPAQTVAQLAVNSGIATEFQVVYELQPSLGVDVQFMYPDAQQRFTLSGANGTFNQNHDRVPPGEYTLTLSPVDYVNQVGHNGVSPTYERWTPANSVYTVRLSSNEITSVTPTYTMRKPVIRLTVTGPAGAANFRSDVAITGPNQLITASGTVSGHEHEVVFGQYCVQARRTDHFYVDSIVHPGGDDCFIIARTPDYGGSDFANAVRVNYRQRAFVGSISYIGHSSGNVKVGDPINFAYEVTTSQRIKSISFYLLGASNGIPFQVLHSESADNIRSASGTLSANTQNLSPGREVSIWMQVHVWPDHSPTGQWEAEKLMLQ